MVGAGLRYLAGVDGGDSIGGGVTSALITIRMFAAACIIMACCVGVSSSVVSAQSTSDDSALASRCEPLANSKFAVNVLILVDASQSLHGRDPERRRVDGVERSVETLNDLVRRHGEQVTARVAIDGFSEDYIQHIDWSTPEQAIRVLRRPGMREQIGETFVWTNYAAALEGAAARFKSAPPSRCNLLIWFTDGEHDTMNAGILTDNERATLNRLCSANSEVGRMTMRDRVTVLSIVLSRSNEQASEGLRLLYNEDLFNPCEVPLNGDYKPYSQMNDIGGQLDEIIAEQISSFLCAGQLPGESCGNEPLVEEYEGCEADNTSGDCVYTFSLDDSVEAFRLYIDKTELRRAIQWPDEIEFQFVAPDGRTESPPIRAIDADRSEWLLINPFEFWAFRPYDSRWEVIGHRAAFDTTEVWAGEWSVKFWGTTPRGQEEALRVAAAVSAIQAPPPKLITPAVNTSGELTGFVEFSESISAALEQEDVELYFAPVDDEANLLYPSWSEGTGHLSVQPVRVEGTDGSFKVPDIGKLLVDRDSLLNPRALQNETNCSVEGGGEMGRRLDTGQTIWLRPKIVQYFTYGPELELRQWEQWVPNSIDVTEAFRTARQLSDEELWGTQLADCIADRAQAEAAAEAERIAAEEAAAVEKRKSDARQGIIKWLEAAERNGGLLPNVLEVVPIDEPPPPDGKARAAAVRVRLSGGVEPGFWSAHISDLDISTKNGSHPTIEGGDRWGCTKHWERSGVEISDAGSSCSGVLTIWSEGAEELELSITVSVAAQLADLQPYLDEIDWHTGAPFDHRTNLEELLKSDKSVTLTKTVPLSIPFPGNPLLPFLLFLAILIVTVGVLAVWRRRWASLSSPEYVVTPITPTSQEDHGVCASLVRRSTKADLGPIRLKSEWLRPLLGLPPIIKAFSVAGGDCWSQERAQNSDGRLIGIVGERLTEGWAAEADEDGTVRVVIWDLPSEDDQAERLTRINSVKAEAVAEWKAILVERAEVEGSDVEVPDFDQIANTAETDPLSALLEDSPQTQTNEPLTKKPLGDDPLSG